MALSVSASKKLTLPMKKRTKGDESVNYEDLKQLVVLYENLEEDLQKFLSRMNNILYEKYGQDKETMKSSFNSLYNLVQRQLNAYYIQKARMSRTTGNPTAE
jgi:hypothetical protein